MIGYLLPLGNYDIQNYSLVNYNRFPAAVCLPLFVADSPNYKHGAEQGPPNAETNGRNATAKPTRETNAAKKAG